MLRPPALAACTLMTVASACSRAPGPPAGGAPATTQTQESSTTPAYGEPRALAKLKEPTVAEASGLAFARTRPGVWFTHNDSGGEPALYAFTLDGTYLGAHPVQGASNRDWEDLAAGPCPTGDERCLYIADIGDNKHVRSEIAVYAVAEPAAGQPAALMATWHARYPGPDGPKNAETLLVHPLTGRLYLVTKDKTGSAEVYRFAAQPSEGPAPLERIAGLQFHGPTSTERKTTAGDWRDDGAAVVIRTYAQAWEWISDPQRPEAHWDQPPRGVDLKREQQGEAIAYTPEGELLTCGEGVPMPLNLVPLYSSSQ